MSEWVYDGYTKVIGNDRKHMIEMWIWKCAKCGNTVRMPWGNKNEPQGECAQCSINRREKDG